MDDIRKCDRCSAPAEFKVILQRSLAEDRMYGLCGLHTAGQIGVIQPSTYAIIRRIND